MVWHQRSLLRRFTRILKIASSFEFFAYVLNCAIPKLKGTKKSYDLQNDWVDPVSNQNPVYEDEGGYPGYPHWP